MRTVFWTALAVLAASAAACGGGGSGGDDDEEAPIAITYEPRTISTASRHGQARTVDLRASLSRKPSGDVYPVVTADAAVFEPGPLHIVETAEGPFMTTVTTLETLPVGTYRGALRLRLCRDTSCAREHRLVGAELPYTVVVEAENVLSVTMGGMPFLPDAYGGYSLSPGSTVTVASTIPVTWGPGSYGDGASMSTISSTATSWTGVINGMPPHGVGITATSLISPDNNTGSVTFTLR